MNGDSWYGRNGAHLKCPVPGCDHVAVIITKVHCRMAHDMERGDIEKMYGAPKCVKKSPGWDVVRG